MEVSDLQAVIVPSIGRVHTCMSDIDGHAYKYGSVGAPT